MSHRRCIHNFPVPWARALLLSAALAGVSSARADDLLDAWRLALARDPEVLVANTLLAQAGLREEQARALWRPQVSAGGTFGAGGQDGRTAGASSNGMSGVRFNTATALGVSAQAHIVSQQAWINPEREAQAAQLTLSAQLAQLQWKKTQQGLMFKTARSYFEVLGAEQALAILGRQQQAIQQAEAEIRKRQRLGDASVMDVQEAESRVASVRAQIVVATNVLDNKKLAYRQLTGSMPTRLAELKVQSTPVASVVSDPPSWVARAKQQSTQLQWFEVQKAIQAQEVKRVQAGKATTVDWVAQAQVDRLTGYGMYGWANHQQLGYVVGVQVHTPLSTGGLVEAREMDAMKQVEKLGYEQDAVALNIESEVRQAWQDVNAAPARQQALEQANKASQAKLVATRHAHRTGVRTTMELLVAEQEAAFTESAVVQSRIQTVLDRLRLYAAADELGEEQLQEINALLH